MILVTVKLLETSRSEDVSRKLLATLWTEAHCPHQTLLATHSRLTEIHGQLEHTSVWVVRVVCGGVGVCICMF